MSKFQHLQSCRTNILSQNVDPIIPSTSTHIENDTCLPQINPDEQITPNSKVALTIIDFSGDTNDLNEKIESLMFQGANTVIAYGMRNQKRTAYVCKTCGREGLKQNIFEHIEACHVEGLSFPCDLCEKSSTTRSALRKHKAIQHKGKQ